MEKTTLESGQVINNHQAGDCHGEWCAIHRPMPGPWDQWKRYWDEDKRIMLRICPHQIGHPVAEMYDWTISQGRALDLIHNCCHQCICAPRVSKRPMSSYEDSAYAVYVAIPDIAIEPAPRNIESEASLEHKMAVLRRGLDFIVAKWPKPVSATVALETHEWQELVGVLLGLAGMVQE